MFQQPASGRSIHQSLRLPPPKSKTSDKPSASRKTHLQSSFTESSSRRRSSSPDQYSSGSEYSDAAEDADHDDKASPPKRLRTYRSPTSPQPTLRLGDRPVDEDIDRSLAVVGDWDPPKCKFAYETVCDDPKNPGQEIPGRPVMILYSKGDDVDFTDSREVKNLNDWRRVQIGIIDSALRGGARRGVQLEEVNMDEVEDSDEEDGEEDIVVKRRASRTTRKVVVDSDEDEDEKREEVIRQGRPYKGESSGVVYSDADFDANSDLEEGEIREDLEPGEIVEEN